MKIELSLTSLMETVKHTVDQPEKKPGVCPGSSMNFSVTLSTSQARSLSFLFCQMKGLDDPNFPPSLTRTRILSTFRRCGNKLSAEKVMPDLRNHRTLATGAAGLKDTRAS